MKIVFATIGYRHEEENGKVLSYTGESTFNGVCYKDKKAFGEKKGICYISEFGLEQIEDDLADLKEKFIFNELTREEYEESREEVFKNNGWTYEDLLNLVGGEGFEKVAEFVFNMVDWQSPETYWDEYQFNPEEDLELFGLTWEQVEKAWNISREDNIFKQPIWSR